MNIKLKKYATSFQLGAQTRLILISNYPMIFVDPCAGDSGAPLWITKKKENTDQNILVAVHYGAQDIFSRQYFQPPCSSVASRAHKITDKVLAWIRKNMERYDK